VLKPSYDTHDSGSVKSAAISTVPKPAHCGYQTGSVIGNWGPAVFSLFKVFGSQQAFVVCVDVMIGSGNVVGVTGGADGDGDLDKDEDGTTGTVVHCDKQILVNSPNIGAS
jgi:hypothetical protein